MQHRKAEVNRSKRIYQGVRRKENERKNIIILWTGECIKYLSSFVFEKSFHSLVSCVCLNVDRLSELKQQFQCRMPHVKKFVQVSVKLLKIWQFFNSVNILCIVLYAG